MLISVIYTSIIYDNYMKRMQMKTYIFLNYCKLKIIFSIRLIINCLQYHIAARYVINLQFLRY